MIDFSKEYQLKDGTPVKIYAVHSFGEWPIHGVFFDGEDWLADSWKECDLVMVHEPETVVTWGNVYENYDSRAGADRGAGADRVAVVRVERTGDKVQCFVEEVFAQ